MTQKRVELDIRTSNLQDSLARTKIDIRNRQKSSVNPNVQAVLCYVEKALKAAKSSGQAESKAYDAALQYDQFSESLAGKKTVDVANTINDMVSLAMINNEPDLHTLASNLSSAIPTSAQSLAGISTAKSAVTEAAAETKKVAIGAPTPLTKGIVPAGGGGAGGGGGGAAKGAKSLDPWTIIELNELIDQSNSLQKVGSRLNNQVETVVDLTPDAIKPKTESCTKLFDQPGSPPDLLTLNPSGYLVLKQGDDQSVVISGGKIPYDVRLMCDCYGKGVVATTQYEGGKATIKISAAADAQAGSYPLMVVDSTGIGRPLVLVVPDPAKTDYSDEPDCAPVLESIALLTGHSSASEGTVAAVLNAVKAAQSAAHGAAKYAEVAATAAAIAGRSADSTAIWAAVTKAAAASQKAQAAAATAKKNAAVARALVTASNDSTLNVYRDSAQAAADQASASAISAATSASQAAQAANTPPPGPGPKH